ncbi:radical SAM protein [Candidatus Woesearchaeota archaeon]|jgi:molybdenum cofactor biosynthesis enzyme MoaA|nr:radical SAM protein [Candidatus Woesearchaeota archaeon]MBT4321995.1 radical SAM protein [Candidatus Woesearchaeota archaeon]MBT4630741.1 radical SAM protein [Candidatus Woesearchaeota archaeon]
MEENLTTSDIKVSMPLYEIRISVTGACNHDCFYCGPFSDGKHDNGYANFGLDQVEGISGLAKENNLHVRLTGGEPSMRTDLLDIVKLLSHNGIDDIGLTTNCSNVDGRDISNLADAGLGALHIHVPSLNRSVFEDTIRKKVRRELINIIETSEYCKRNNVRVEFNTPVTRVNLDSLPELMSFCYDRKINLKLIEEVNMKKDQINETEITELMENWLSERGSMPMSEKIEKVYGSVYNFDDFFFRIAPATPDLVDHLQGKERKILLDGRYWIGGRNGNYLFTPSYFLKPMEGDIGDLKRDFNHSLGLYNEKK